MPIVETHASVTVYLDEQDVGAFQAAVGLGDADPGGPGFTQRQPPGRPRWSLESRGRVSGDTDDHVRWLLDRLEPVSETLKEAVNQGAQAWLWVYWLADNAGPHVWISSDVVARVAALGLSLHIDAYREYELEDAKTE